MTFPLIWTAIVFITIILLYVSYFKHDNSNSSGTDVDSAPAWGYGHPRSPIEKNLLDMGKDGKAEPV